eukprot:GFUD01048149.1.p1 GENE.GFUD01048149.1~~GFUD01048149.1.p1  ORF type:complete len:107 (+),score=19.94 GFUD01048149.1:45-323(+)
MFLSLSQSLANGRNTQDSDYPVFPHFHPQFIHQSNPDIILPAWYTSSGVTRKTPTSDQLPPPPPPPKYRRGAPPPPPPRRRTKMFLQAPPIF